MSVPVPDLLIDIEIEAEAWLEHLPACDALVRQAVKAALAAERTGYDPASELDIVILLTDDEAMRALNAGFRGKDKPTNILSFPPPPEMARLIGQQHLGDLALGLETCLAEAEAQGKRLEDHVRHLSVHGVLHLLGYDHETEAEAVEMEGRERDILAGMGIADPYQLETDGA